MDSADLATLTTLDALLQEAGVSAAARRVGLSAPAVSHALARLRERFEDPLLVRAGRRMVLSPRAQELKPRVRAAVQAAEGVFRAHETFGVTFDPARLKDNFRISCTDYVLSVVGPALEKRLARERLFFRYSSCQTRQTTRHFYGTENSTLP